MIIETTHVNQTEGHLLFEPVFCNDPFTEDPGELFRFAQKEYGRCVSSIYIDRDNETVRIGWVFEKTEQYEDTGDSFIMETWITLHTKEPTVTRELHYLTI